MKELVKNGRSQRIYVIIALCNFSNISIPHNEFIRRLFSKINALDPPHINSYTQSEKVRRKGRLPLNPGWLEMLELTDRSNLGYFRPLTKALDKGIYLKLC